MDFQGYKRKILLFDRKTTDAVYDDENIHRLLNYKASIDNSGLKPTIVSANAEYCGSQQRYVYTREGERKSFMRYDLMKKLLKEVVTRLEAEEDSLPNDDDIVLYENVRSQQTELYQHNIRLTGCVLDLYFKKNSLHKKHWQDYEAETLVYLLSAIYGFNYTFGYRFSTYFYRIALNNLKAFFDSNYKRIRRFKTNSLSRSKINGFYNDIVDRAPMAQDLAQVSEDHLNALDSINTLKLQERHVILASFYSKEVVTRNTCIQVCRLLGITPNRYKSLSRSAYKKLRMCEVMKAIKLE